MASCRQSSRSFVASILTLLACTAFISTGFVVSAEAAVQKAKIDDPNIPKIDLLLSGGGLRASAFAYGVLAGLNEICISADYTTFTPRTRDQQGELKDCSGGVPLLDKVNIISAVSGGAITAAYFKSHREEFFEEFPKLLKKSHIERRLLTTAKPFSLKRLLRAPVFLLSSLWDFIGIPLSLLNLHVELTPIAVMALSDGLLDSKQLATVYKDLFYQDTRLDGSSERNGFPFEAIAQTGKGLSANDPTLLINATDITNGTVFTFDERTFECMGIRSERGRVELALAVAASSSLPGVFAPVRIDDILERTDAQTIPSDCPAVLADRTRPLVLVDGGVADNLGAIGLLRRVIKRKEDYLRTTAGSDPNSHDFRKEKHLLLIINSEAESDSKLPGLAGHFDASYDVLLRSKKDLVRVMASNMFNHFGFANLEFRLWDLVTSEPGISGIISRAVERLGEGTIKEAEVTQVVPQSLIATDQEHKIKRNLDQIGMLPSAEEIDTLIAAGRKVVSHRYYELQASYLSLRDKVFASSCSGIHNPDKYWCWPNQFRSHDLDSGGGSAFLEVLTQTTTDFVEQAATLREKRMWETRRIALHLIQEESILQEGYGDDLSLQNKKDSLLKYIKNSIEAIKWDDDLHSLYSATVQCKEGIEALRERLENIEAGSTSRSVDEISRSLVQGLKMDFQKSKCSPHYYELLTLAILFQNNSPDHLDDMIAVLQDGIRDADQNLNSMELHHSLGFNLINYFSDFNRGLKHIGHAIEIARTHETHLKRMAGDLTDYEKIKRQIERMHVFQRYNQLAMAQYIPLSQLPRAVDVEEIPEDQVFRWERRNLTSREGISILEIILSRGVDRDVQNQLDEIISSLQHRMTGEEILLGLKHLREAHLPKSIPGPCRDKDANLPHTNHRRADTLYCRIVHTIRGAIRSYLAESAGLYEAEEYSKSLYSEYLAFLGRKAQAPEQSASFFNGMGPEILATHGFLVLSRNMESPCPARARAVRDADALFLEAIEDLKQVQVQLKLAEAQISPILRRFQRYHQLAGELDCPGSFY